jgi:outer membrane protein OmpA-like peptidoglycan-associated protein
MRRFVLLGLATAAMVGPIAAQSSGIPSGTVEIGAFFKATQYPDTFHRTRSYSRVLDDYGIGGRIGIFFARNLALELDASHSDADILVNPPTVLPTPGYPFYRDMNYIPVHLQLIYNAPLSEHFFWEFGAGANYQWTSYPFHRKDVGVGGITGLRIRMGNRFSLRGEGTADLVPKGYAKKSNLYLGGQVGVSWLFGGKYCDHGMDVNRIQPTSATLAPGETQTFTASAMYCGEPDEVVYRLTGPGTLDSMTGMYRATTVGTAQVTAYSMKGKITSAAAITINAPMAAPPPAPAPVQTPPPPPPAPAPPPPPPHYTFDLGMVHFRFDHADLTKGGQDTVRGYAETLKAHPEVNVDVVGHTDWIGTEEYNMKLSRARAETVRRLLVSLGVDDSRIAVKWRGKDEPIADNKTKAGRDMNRRVEIKQNN